MKRLSLWVMLCTALVLGLSYPALASDGMENFVRVNQYIDGRFSDVSENSWYAGYVADAYELGLMQGTGDTTFRPGGSLTIAQTIALACRLNNIYHGDNTEFVQGHPWYQVYVDYAINYGIISARQFAGSYTAPATRAQFARILAASLPDKALEEVNSIDFIPDVPEDSYAADDIYRLYRAGILTGSDKVGTFYPQNTISRSEVAAVIVRMADASRRVDFSLDGAFQFLLRDAVEGGHYYGDEDAYEYVYSSEPDITGELYHHNFALYYASGSDQVLATYFLLPSMDDRDAVYVVLELDSALSGMYKATVSARSAGSYNSIDFIVQASAYTKFSGFSGTYDENDPRTRLYRMAPRLLSALLNTLSQDILSPAMLTVSELGFSEFTADDETCIFTYLKNSIVSSGEKTESDSGDFYSIVYAPEQVNGSLYQLYASCAGEGSETVILGLKSVPDEEGEDWLSLEMAVPKGYLDDYAAEVEISIGGEISRYSLKIDPVYFNGGALPYDYDGGRQELRQVLDNMGRYLSTLLNLVNENFLREYGYSFADLGFYYF